MNIFIRIGTTLFLSLKRLKMGDFNFLRNKRKSLEYFRFLLEPFRSRLQSSCKEVFIL